MSRLTGSEAQSLMEAYNAVYAPQELTEEQIWEQVENWVNSLLEKGHDLSEYTWEEMYESYLSEMGQRATTGQVTAPKAPPIVQSKPIDRIAGGGMGGMRGSGRDRNPTQTSSSPGALRVNSTATPATQPPRQQPPAPTAPAAKPAPTAPAAKPAPTAPAAATTPPKPSTSVGFNAPPAGSPPPSAAYTAAKPAATPAPAPAAAPAPTAPAAPPKPTKRFDIRDRPVGARAGFDPRFDKQSFDLFDVIKGHLLDEGYADNEDAALAIMSNMSEEWKESIIESQYARENPEKYEREQAKAKSKKQRAMEDPHKGINSPAFEKFMRQQMGR